MPQHPISGPDFSQDAPSLHPVSGTGALRAQPDDASFETDFQDLAARFAAQSGGGLSPELSADLALEIVLNEVVEQACLATGATGAAIVLQRDGEMICRARSGATAPELGARLDSSSGLSGECVRTLRTQRSGDVMEDPRADAAASKRLGIRSVMVMPLLRAGGLVGVFELFSSRPNAFGERDELTVEALASRTLSNLERAAERLEAHPAVLPEAEPFSEIPRESSEDAPRGRFDFVTTSLWVAVLVCVMLLGVLLGRHFGVRRASVRTRPAAVASAVATPAAEAGVPESISNKNEHPNAVARKSTATNSVTSSVPPGGLLVSENGKEVFRMPPAPIEAGAEAEEQGSGMQRASTLEPERIVTLSPAAAEGSLVRRVEPKYPEEARQQQVQGAVVLDVHIGANGSVQDVQVVSGAPLLAQASTDAVKQWRFRARKVNGRAVEMETRVTLNFRLP